MNLLENYIKEIYSENIINHKGLGEMVEVSMKSVCYGRETIGKQWFKPNEWEAIKGQGYFMA